MAKNQIKIILSGLDNAGKSSMIVGLKKMYNLDQDLAQILPTIRIDFYRRKFLEHFVLNCFDMGGQLKFRELYLKRPMYFEDLNLFMYLIDIQDEIRFQESVDYLGKVLEILESNGYDRRVPLHICFSKADFVLLSQSSSDYFSRIEMIKNLLSSTYPTFEFRYFLTSIFNIYSIVQVIYSGLRNLLPPLHEIEYILENFGTFHEVQQVMVFDRSGMILGNYGKDTADNFEFKNWINNIVSSHLEFFKHMEDNKLEIAQTRSVDKEGDTHFLHLCQNIDIPRTKTDDPMPDEYSKYYISLIIPQEHGEKAEKELPGMIESITKIIRTHINS
ncbi:hypothetical protein ES708_09003 [subsurface metagenome]